MLVNEAYDIKFSGLHLNRSFLQSVNVEGFPNQIVY